MIARTARSLLGRAAAVLQSLEDDTPIAGGPQNSQGKRPQLELFAPPPSEDREILTQIRALEPDRMTPIEALQLLSQLKQKLSD